MRFAAETHTFPAATVVKPTIYAGVSPLHPQFARFPTAIYQLLHGTKLFLRGAGQVTDKSSVSWRLLPAFRAPKLPATQTKRACHVANLTLKRAQQKIMSGVGLRPTNHRSAHGHESTARDQRHGVLPSCPLNPHVGGCCAPVPNVCLTTAVRALCAICTWPSSEHQYQSKCRTGLTLGHRHGSSDRRQGHPGHGGGGRLLLPSSPPPPWSSTFWTSLGTRPVL